MIRLIQNQKYDRHLALIFTCASDLLTNANDYASLNRFWDLIHNKSRDLIGFRHLQLLVLCIDEGRCSDSIETKDQIIYYITNWVQYILSLKHCVLKEKLEDLLRNCTSLAKQSAIQNILLQQLQTKDQTIAKNVISLISTMPSSDSSIRLSPLASRHLDAQNSEVRNAAVRALAKLGEKAATSEVLSRLVISLGYSDENVRSSASEALGSFGKNAATSEVIRRLVISLGDSDEDIRSSTCEALERLGKKAATSAVISRLVISLENSDKNVRSGACQVLGRLSENAGTSEVISRLVISLGSSDKYVRCTACEALGRLGKMAATSKVISELANVLVDHNYLVRFAAVRSVNKLVSVMRRGRMSEGRLPADSGEQLISESRLIEDSNICTKPFQLLLESEDTSLIPGCLVAAVSQNCYAIIIENRIVVGGDSQHLKIELSNGMMKEVLRGFDDLWRQITNIYGTRGVALGRKQKPSYIIVSSIIVM